MIKGSQLYDMTLPLIDYCGDVRGNHDGYSQKYSPNNIRRLYISPDGSLVLYHVNVGKGKRKAISYNSDVVMECSSLPDYVPILYVLSADRVCASVEDVVICTGSNNGATLDMREMNFTGLVKSYKGGGTDIKQQIMNRYKRLNSFIIYNGTLGDFLNRTKDVDSADKVLTDSPFVNSSCEVELFHNKDWFSNYGFSAKFYALDRQGSQLNNHFVKVSEVMSNRAENAEFEKFKKEKVKGLQDEFNTNYSRALNLVKGYTRLKIMESKNGSSYFNISLPEPKFLILMQTESTKNSPNLVKTIEASGTDKEVLEFNLKACKEYCLTFYSEMLEALLNGLISINQIYPLTATEILNEFDRAIKVPPNLQAYNSKLPKPLLGSRWVDSVANMCILLGVISIAEFKQLDKGAWLKCIN